MKTVNIKVKAQISDIIATRQSVKLLFKNLKLNDSKEFILDFSDVTFISRSAADQLYKEKQKTKLKITFINLSDNIKKMLDIVAKTQNGSPRKPYEVPIIKFKNKTSLSKFLSSI